MPQKIVGLDIGTYSIKVAVIESTFRNYEFVEFNERLIPRDPEVDFKDRVFETLQSMIEEGILQHDVIVTSIPGEKITNKLLDMPFKDNKKIDQILGFEVENHLPISQDQIVYDYYVTQQRDDGCQVMSMVTTTEFFETFLDFLENLKLDPRIITSDPVSYLSLDHLTVPSQDEAEVIFPFGWTLAEEPEDEEFDDEFEGEEDDEKEEEKKEVEKESSKCIIDFGYSSTNICLIEGGKLVKSRTIKGGGETITSAIMENLGVDYQIAEREKINSAKIVLGQEIFSPEEQKLSDTIVSSLYPTLRFIKQTVYFYQKYHQKIDRIFVCGGTSQLKNLDQHLANQLNIPVEHLSPLKKDLLNFGQLSSPPAILTKGLALALSSLGVFKGAGINFRKGAYSYKGDFQSLKDKLPKIVVGVLILILLLGFNVFSRFHVINDRQNRMDTVLADFTKEMFGRAVKDYTVASSMVTQQSLPSASPIPHMSALDILNEISARIPKDVTLELQELEVTLKKIRIKGETDSFEAVDKIVNSLKEYECFSETEKGRVKKTYDGSKIEFNLNVLITSC